MMRAVLALRLGLPLPPPERCLAVSWPSFRADLSNLLD